MKLVESMMVAVSGMRAQGSRMRVIAENVANQNSTGKTPGADPYRRKVVTFENELNRDLGVKVVKTGRPSYDKSAFSLKRIPGHPAADENGYVKMPNVNGMIEAMDMREAQRSYEANLNIVQASRNMLSRTIGMLRR